MANIETDYGILLNNNMKLQRHYFKEMTKLLGINCKYYAPLANKKFNTYGDLESNYQEAISVAVIFEEHPDQKTLKKLGWVAELQESSSLIHVPYDLPGLEVGALFEVPGGLDTAKERLFRVISMKVGMICPASITCEIAPEYINTSPVAETYDFKQNNFTKLIDLEEDD